VTIGLFVWWFFSTGVPAVVWLAPLAVQGALAFRWGRAFGGWFGRAGSRAPGLRRHHALFEAWESYAADDETVRALQSRLTDQAGLRASSEIRGLERWLDLGGSQGSMVHQIVALLFLWDVHVAVGLERWRRRAGPSIETWFDALGELEALSALATLAYDQPEWTFPRIVDGEARLEASSLGHPLLGDDVRRTSDVRLEPPGRFLLVTGSNMSGKSTLLRSIGLAAVMGQAGSVVCASNAELTALRTFTSMRIHDSLTGGVSLFMAELLRLKALVDAADEPDGRALLYLVDEVLQGTNSEERRVAARGIIRHLLGANAIGAVTTHDLALHEEEVLDRASTKVHFREHVDASGGDVLTFDYRLRPGLATSRNALRLLGIVGLSVSPEDA
jgi:DNA mismatch repair ATPase MutS